MMAIQLKFARGQVDLLVPRDDYMTNSVVVLCLCSLFRRVDIHVLSNDSRQLLALDMSRTFSLCALLRLNTATGSAKLQQLCHLCLRIGHPFAKRASRSLKLTHRKRDDVRSAQ